MKAASASRDEGPFDMQDSHVSSVEPGVPGSRTSPALDDSKVQPSSSRMLTNYLADVEQNLDEQRWELALRDVVELPKIAVALANPEMRSTREQCVAWCEQWVRPANAANDSGIDHEHICRLLDEQSEEGSPTAGIPSIALKRLRLRRHARHVPRGFTGTCAVDENEDHAETFAVCTAVVEGIRRWYAHFACHDATAQANLARLAVLR
jgi:hypothetical protein